MNNVNVVLTRIDNRLVHGQVGILWTGSIGANLIVVVDDAVANEPFQQQLMTMTANQSGVGIRFFSVEQAVQIIPNASPDQKIFIICKTPETALKLAQSKIPLGSVNVGNMHSEEGKRRITKRVYVNDQDLGDLNAIKKLGISVFIQDVPGEPIIEVPER